MLNTNEVRTVCKGDFMWIKGIDGIDNQWATSVNK